MELAMEHQRSYLLPQKCFREITEEKFAEKMRYARVGRHGVSGRPLGVPVQAHMKICVA